MRLAKMTIRTILLVCVTIAVMTPAVRALPSDPNNAALLYYQAFIMLPKGQDQVRDLAVSLRAGVDPNDQIREYLKQCQPAINLAEAASRIPACDWGLQYSKGFQMPMLQLSQMRAMSLLMKADALVFIADGQYRQALEQALTIRRMAQHTGDQILISLLVSIAIDAIANNNIQNTLSAMPPDAVTLSWLQSELATAMGKQLTFQNALETERQMFMAKLSLGSAQLLEALGGSVDEVPAGLIGHLKSGDTSFLDRSGTYFQNHVKAVQAIISSAGPCQQKMGQLGELAKRLELDAKENPFALLTATTMPAVTKVFTLEARAKSSDSMLKAAIEIYIVRANTGSLPSQLPSGAPKDVFTGQDFKYTKTKDGFKLSRWTDDPTGDTTYQYEFKVK